MKTKLKLFGFAMFLTLMFAMPSSAVCQEKRNGPPPWAPAHGYRAKVRHVYFPDYNFYYDLQKGVYIYLGKNGWQVNVNLPSLFGSINLKNTLKVELDLSTDTPQKYNSSHIKKYKSKKKNNKETSAKGNGNKK